MTKYSQIPDGAIFSAGGAQYRKLDAMYFVDLASGFESTWTPLFEASIDTGNLQKSGSDAPPNEPPFLVDPQSRMMKANPAYVPPTDRDAAKLTQTEHFFGEMWGSGSFDCGPYEYEYMANTAILAIRTLNHVADILGLPYKEGHYDNILHHLTASTKPKKAAKAKKVKE